MFWVIIINNRNKYIKGERLKPENKLQIDTIVKMFVVCICVALYALGGSDMMGKWARRFAMPIVYCVTAFYYTRDWKTFIQLPLMCGTLCMGYGVNSSLSKIAKIFTSNDVGVKIIIRGLYGLFTGFSFNIYPMIRKNYITLGIGLFMAVSAYILLGVYNPYEARIEESFLSLALTWNLLTMTRKKDEV